MLVLAELSKEQKEEIDRLFKQLIESDALPFTVIEKEGYIAIYSTNPYVIKSIVLEAVVSLLKRGKV